MDGWMDPIKSPSPAVLHFTPRHVIMQQHRNVTVHVLAIVHVDKLDQMSSTYTNIPANAWCAE